MRIANIATTKRRYNFSLIALLLLPILLLFFYFFIVPKASAEGACILSKMGYYFRVWLVTEIVVCVVTVMLWYMGHT